MSRAQAIEIARKAAADSRENHAYLKDAAQPGWMPHEWVIQAILLAAANS